VEDGQSSGDNGEQQSSAAESPRQESDGGGTSQRINAGQDSYAAGNNLEITNYYLGRGGGRRSPINGIIKRILRVISAHRRLASAGTVIVILLGVALALYPAKAPGNAAGIASGGIALIREDGQPRLIFPIASGGIGYCLRSDDNWPSSWTGQEIDSSWPGISHAATFFSGFSGFEILGVNNGILTFGYRDNGYHENGFQWHNPKPVLDDESGNPVEGVIGRPGFFQYWPDESKDAKFLALVPVASGGLDLYARDGISQEWHMMGVIASGLGRITSVTLTYQQGQQISAVLRVGTRLFELTRGSQGLPGQFATGWTEPRELKINDGKQIAATGDPDLIYSDVPGSAVGATFWLAVPVQQGLALLSSRYSLSDAWSAESLPVSQQPDSVAILDGYTGGHPSLEIAYRMGEKLYSLWRPDGGAWQGPTEIHCI
jgi:hypothetical protein